MSRSRHIIQCLATTGTHDATVNLHYAVSYEMFYPFLVLLILVNQRLLELNNVGQEVIARPQVVTKL